MQDSRWQVDAPAGRRRGLAWWMLLPLGLGGVALLAVATVVIRVASTRRTAWPITRQVAARLETDEDARRLYAENPALASVHPSAEAFLEELHAWRPRFGTLPEATPPEDDDTFQCVAGLDHLRVAVKGRSGAWMALALAKPVFGADVRDLGGGITDLGFAANRRELLERRLKRLQAGAVPDSPPDWARFRDLATDLGTDAGVARLLTSHPQLPQARTPAAFEARVRAWRPRLEALPATFPGARGGAVIHRGGTGPRATVTCRFSRGGGLSATWASERLLSVDLAD